MVIKIKVSKDGPYLVSGKVPLDKEVIEIGNEGEPENWSNGQKYPDQEGYALCRCGKSKACPFCDGAHLSGFDGRETAPLVVESKGIIEGPELTLTDATELCAGARFCHRSGGTWELVRSSDDPNFMEIAIKESCNCPSGRLTVARKDGNVIEPDFKPSISVTEDPQKRCSGPLWVKGKIPIESSEGSQYEVRNRVTLCRCGMSQNKPFCDGSHMDGFDDGDESLK